MRDKSARSLAWLLLAVTLLFQEAALAETGIDITGSIAQETSQHPLSTITVDWQRVTLSPWWRNDEWRLSADLPFVTREAERHGPFGGLLAVESDSGPGDASLRARREWLVDTMFTAYVGGYLKLPTGDEYTGTLLVPGSVRWPTRQGQYSLGTGSTDVGLAPGIRVGNEHAWAAAEAGFIVSDGGTVTQDDRPVAYTGFGLTPSSFLEFSVAIDYEGEASPGAGDLQQITFTLTLTPVRHFAVYFSTYTDENPTAPDENWTLGFAAGW